MSSALASANPRNFGVKRLMKEYSEFQRAAESDGSNEYFTAAPCDDNLFEWHFTIRGPPDSDYAGGRYHGRILLPSQYPFKPPDIVMLTPSGRFETNKKICLSISSFHPKNWQPSWSIRTVLTALIAFFPTPGNGAIGSLEYSSHERKEWASRSANWHCELCGKTNVQMLPDLAATAAPPKLDKEVQDTIDANKSIAAVTVSSQPSTPALGPTSVPATPIPLGAAQQIADQPTPAATPLLQRAHSDPTTTTTHNSAEMKEDGSAAAVAAAIAAAGNNNTSPLSPLVLDEGLRQRQGRVVLPNNNGAAAAPAASAVAAPAAAAPAVAVAPAQPPAREPLSVFTVFLTFLIILILARKLYASVHAKPSFSFDFSQD